MDKNAELRAAAEEIAAMDLTNFCRDRDTAWRMRMLILFARHILATVPADAAEPVTVGDTITVELLESWGGVVCGKMHSFLMPHPFGAHLLAVQLDDDRGPCVLFFVAGYWRFLRIGITSAADLRKLLELLGCKLKGGAQ